MLFGNHALKTIIQIRRKRNEICGIRAGVGLWELDEGTQRVQTSSYKINKYEGCNVQHDKYNLHSFILYMKVVMQA